MNKEIEALEEALTGKTKQTQPKQPTAVPVQKPAAGQEKLTGKQATAGLVLLAGILLAFFIGMRWLNSRPAEPTTEAASLQTAQERDLSVNADRININTASLSELTSLHGIGDKKAQAIIDYRNEYGPFTSVDEIMEVEGIGEGIFAAIKDHICV